jgi:hypothetical protein
MHTDRSPLIESEAAWERTQEQCKHALELHGEFPQFGKDAILQSLAINTLTDLLLNRELGAGASHT